MTDEENGRAVIARAGVRLARAKAVRWRNIVLNNGGGGGGGGGRGWVWKGGRCWERGSLEVEGEFEAASARR